MNLSVSNIAWRPEESEDALNMLQEFGIKNLEVAPSLLFQNPTAVSSEEIAHTRVKYERRGFTIVALQSLLFGAPPYSIFDESDKVSLLFEYLKKIIRVAHELGAATVVFGSPKHRFIRNVESTDTEERAVAFFRKLSAVAQDADISIALEANAATYGCNFILTTDEAITFVKKVDHAHFKLNLDTGNLVLSQDPERVVKQATPYVTHVHISSPNLGDILNEQLDHAFLARIIKTMPYNGPISLEKRASQVTGDNMPDLKKNLEIFCSAYGSRIEE